LIVTPPILSGWEGLNELGLRAEVKSSIDVIKQKQPRSPGLSQLGEPEFERFRRLLSSAW